MDFIFEILIQFVIEVLGEFLVEVGFRGAAAVLRSWVGRYVITVIAGFGGGLWWGAHLTARGRTQEPRTLWVSLGLAAICAVWALLRRTQKQLPDQRTGFLSIFAPPWRWPAYRFAGFAALNAAIAGGVLVGFRPHHH
jgi:hypothetical protein